MAKGKAGEPVVSGQQAGKLAESYFHAWRLLEGVEGWRFWCAGKGGGPTEGMGHSTCVDCTRMS